MPEPIAPGTIKIVSEGLAGWDTHILCMQKDGEWVEIPSVTEFHLDPINATSGPLMATLRIISPRVDVRVLPESIRIEVDRRDASGVEFAFTDAARLQAAADFVRWGRPRTFLPTSAQAASPAGAMR